MLFSEFKTYIPKIQNTVLGGLDAQFKLAPIYRKKYDLNKIQANNPTLAGVLIVFFANIDNQTSFILTERANYNGHHANQISFPGGKIDRKDNNLIDTAIRETSEEIGLIVNPSDIFRELTEVFIPPSNFLAHPFLAIYEGHPVFTTNYEVEQILTPSMSDLLDDKNKQLRKVSLPSGKQIETPCFVFDNCIVWGATAMMLNELHELLKEVLVK